jgi:acyl-CoA reductase-like NAD-dependent aldehyde dehydrogenase
VDGPAYTMPPNAEHVKMMRALVKEMLGRSLTTALGEDIAQACETLKEKGKVHHTERKKCSDSPDTERREGERVPKGVVDF